MLAEAGIAVVLLAVTTVLTSTEPGAGGGGGEAGHLVLLAVVRPSSLKLPFDTAARTARAPRMVTLDPARVGGNEMHV